MSERLKPCGTDECPICGKWKEPWEQQCWDCRSSHRQPCPDCADLNKRIDSLRELTKIQCMEGNWDFDMGGPASMFGCSGKDACTCELCAKRIREERDHLRDQIAEKDAEIGRLRTDNEEYQSLFDLQHKRMVEASKMWQDETGRHDVYPDLGALLTWLMDRIALGNEVEQQLVATIAKKDAEIERLKAAIPCVAAECRVEACDHSGKACYLPVDQAFIHAVNDEGKKLRTQIATLREALEQIKERTMPGGDYGNIVRKALAATEPEQTTPIDTLQGSVDGVDMAHEVTDGDGKEDADD